MNGKKLTQREECFCRYYAALGNLREAAVKAGFLRMPEYKGMCLLAKRSVKKRISELEREGAADNNAAVTGLRRIAFGSVADAVKLALSCGGEPPDVDRLDLFSVSEIKYTQNKGMEIKFFDRLKALERLSELTGRGAGSAALSIYEALERSASGTGEGKNG